MERLIKRNLRLLEVRELLELRTVGISCETLSDGLWMTPRSVTRGSNGIKVLRLLEITAINSLKRGDALWQFGGRVGMKRRIPLQRCI